MEFVLNVNILGLRKLSVKPVDFIRPHTTFSAFVYNATSQTLLNRLHLDVASVRVPFKQNRYSRYHRLCTWSGVTSTWNVTYDVRRAVWGFSIRVFRSLVFGPSSRRAASPPNDRWTFSSGYFGNSMVVPSFAVAGYETRPTFHV